MKKFFVVVLIVMLVLALMACGKSAQEKIVEEMLEQSAAESGEDVDIDIDGDGDGSITINNGDEEVNIDIDSDDGNSGTVTVSDGDEEMVVESDEDGMVWPGDKLPGNVPKLTGVKIVTVQALTQQMVNVYFEECDASDADAYVSAMKANGWEIVVEMDLEGAHQTQGQIGEEWLQFSWAEEDGAGWVSYSTGE